MCDKNVFVGFSLIEVMVSLLVLNIGLLTLLGSAAKAMHLAREAYYQDITTSQVYKVYEYSLMSSGHGLSRYQFMWDKENKRLLPNAEGRVEQTDHKVKVSLCWFYGKKICYRRVFDT